MKIKQLDSATVGYFVGSEFYYFTGAENFLYEDGKKTDKVDGIKVTVYSKENPTQFLTVKVQGDMSEIEDIKVHDRIGFKNLTGRFWIKKFGNFSTIELSLKADKVEYTGLKM